jgi:L-amino acid N-acyltransferase YncA
MRIDPLGAGDWPAVRAIYEAGIATGDATFETDVPDWPAWDAAHLADHRLVARDDSTVVGWVALAAVSDRRAYAGVAEDSIYVAPDAQGRGVGRALLAAVVASADRGGIWTIQTGIFPENQASVRLHQACGFRSSGSGSAWAGCTAAGATCCCWSAAARPSPDGGHCTWSSNSLRLDSSSSTSNTPGTLAVKSMTAGLPGATSPLRS